MNKIVGLVIVAAVAVGGYFGGQAMGLFGGEKAMSPEEVSSFLEAHAAEINGADGGLSFDDFSKLVNATHIEKQITIRGDSILNMEQLDESYLSSREAQVANKLCSDEQARAALAGGARFVYNWFSADNERIGGVDAKGATYCADNGYDS